MTHDPEKWEPVFGKIMLQKALSIEDDIAFFERVPTLGLLGRAALRILAIGAESRYVHGGEVLFNAGDPADCGFVIQEGSFRRSAEAGRASMTVRPRHAGRRAGADRRNRAAGHGRRRASRRP